MTEKYEWERPLQNIPIAVLPLDWDLDGDCIVCGGDLDTGLECTECGADHMPAALQRERKKR